MTKSSGIRAVLIDLDDTLIIEEAHARSQLRATAGPAGISDGGTGGSRLTPDTWVDHVIETARSFWWATPYTKDCNELGIASWEGLWASFAGAHARIAPLRDLVAEYRHDTWTTALETAGLDPTKAAALSEMYIEGQRAGHPLDPGAEDFVRRAAEVAPLALVTNGPPDIQRLKLEQTGLAEWFGAVIISGELGVGKPDPAIFEQALTALGLGSGAVSQAVMVGDSWERDIEGALGAGLAGAVWISHGREIPTSEVPAPRVTVARDTSGVSFD